MQTANKTTLLLLAISFIGMSACSDAGEFTSPVEPVPLNPTNVTEPLTAPVVRLLSPPSWQAGEIVTVLGSNFAPPNRGYTVVRLNGEFVEDGGQSRKVSIEQIATYRNAGKVEFMFESAEPPNGFGSTMGSFFGIMTAVNANEEETSDASDPVEVSVDMEPSLVIWSVQPSSGPCHNQDRITATIVGQKIKMEVEAIGLARATTYTPLEYVVSYVDLEGVVHRGTARLTSDSRVIMPLSMGGFPSDAQADNGDIYINLEVKDGYGETLKRTYTINIGLEDYVEYDGNERIVEQDEPVLVKYCMPGADYGRQVSYSENKAESQSRSVSFSGNAGGISLWVVNLGFGFSVNETISSSTSQSLSMSGTIYGGQWGVFYRQTLKFEKLGDILHRTVCGQSSVMGEARVTDWDWVPDLAVTQNGECPPVPPSNLPPAQVFP